MTYIRGTLDPRGSDFLNHHRSPQKSATSSLETNMSYTNNGGYNPYESSVKTYSSTVNRSYYPPKDFSPPPRGPVSGQRSTDVRTPPRTSGKSAYPSDPRRPAGVSRQMWEEGRPNYNDFTTDSLGITKEPQTSKTSKFSRYHRRGSGRSGRPLVLGASMKSSEPPFIDERVPWDPSLCQPKSFLGDDTDSFKGGRSHRQLPQRQFSKKESWPPPKGSAEHYPPPPSGSVHASSRPPFASEATLPTNFDRSGSKRPMTTSEWVESQDKYHYY